MLLLHQCTCYGCRANQIETGKAVSCSSVISVLVSQDSYETRSSIVFLVSFIFLPALSYIPLCAQPHAAATRPFPGGLILRPRFRLLRSLGRSAFSCASPRMLISRRPLAFSTSKSALEAPPSSDTAFGDAVNDCVVLPFCQQLFVYTKRRASLEAERAERALTK